MKSSANVDSIAQQVRDRVLASRGETWRVEDFEDLDRRSGTTAGVSNELRRLVARGELKRLKRGVYWRGNKGRFGMSSPSGIDSLLNSVGTKEAAGATGWYATNLLGLSTQIAPVETLAITHRKPEGLKNVNVATRQSRQGRRESRLSPLEVTFLEALEGWERYVEVDSKTALIRFGDLLDRKDVRAKKLVQASRTEPPVVRERLREVLMRSGYMQEASKVRMARDPRTRNRALEVFSI